LASFLAFFFASFSFFATLASSFFAASAASALRWPSALRQPSGRRRRRASRERPERPGRWRGLRECGGGKQRGDKGGQLVHLV
jgi:hypothetical protein